MEHGSLVDSSTSSFSIMEEDHTLANSVRFVLNQDPRVAFCGYSIPHPAEHKVNIRVQATVDPAKDVMKDALQDLMLMGQHVRGTFDKAVAEFKSKIPAEQIPRVAFCGYNFPHPANNKVKIRVQTTGDPAKDVMKDALQDLMVMGQLVRGTFDKAVAEFKSKIRVEQMDVDSN